MVRLRRRRLVLAARIFRRRGLLIRHRPQVVIFEWWTGTVLHTLPGARAAGAAHRREGVVEFHEILGPARRHPVRGRYIARVAPILFRLADGYAVHSEFDRELAIEHWRLGRRSGRSRSCPMDRTTTTSAIDGGHVGMADRCARHRRTSCNLLFFGVIRPYKGLEHLVAAFEAIPESRDRRATG